MDVFSVEGKVVIVTGSAQGIGKEIAKAFAENKALPVVVDIKKAEAENTAKELAEITGKEPVWYAVDLTNVSEIKRFIDDVVARFGKIDVLVNNAGILDFSQIEDLEEEQWDRVIECNLKSVFFCSKYTFEKMKAAGKGRIINVASVAGRMGGISAGCAYAASKGGMIALTMSFARKAAPFGVSVNAIAPGTVEKGMSSNFTPEQSRKVFDTIPMQRFAKLSEIAYATLFLATDASSYMCGAVLDVNGGMYM